MVWPVARIDQVSRSGVRTTLAGSGTAGSADGDGIAASFNNPSGIAMDGSGNFYVADTGNRKIRKVTPRGSVTTLAGSGQTGSADGIGTAASFNYPQAVAVDGSGNVYVADYLKIRKITSAGLVTTLAGSGQSGSADGVGTAASFNLPVGVAVDGSGNVYVADYFNAKIRKITPDGAVSTLAGSGIQGSEDGTGAAASFNKPLGIVVDRTGDLLVVDWLGGTIRRVTPAGVVTTVSSLVCEATGRPAATQWDGIAADGSGNLVVADQHGQTVWRINPRGLVTRLAGFSYPYGVAVDGFGNVLVTEGGTNKIRKIAPTGAVTTLAGSGDIGRADGTGAEASFRDPRGIAVDRTGNAYVADTWNQVIRKVTPEGVVTTLAGGYPGYGIDGTGAAASFNFPEGVAVDGASNVLVADTDAGRIRKITPGGQVTTLAGGKAGVFDFADGIGREAAFHFPTGIAVDSSGSAYVADSWNYVIRKVTPEGVVTTVAGSWVGTKDGTGAEARFSFPTNLCTDASGNVYVTDDSGGVRVGRVMGSATCTPDATSLCLLGGRFRVTADYVDYAGGGGKGNAVYLTPDTGYFWFFSSTNAEVVTKIVDFCGSSGQVGFYAAGLTDLDVTLRVTDTLDGTTRIHRSSLGTPFVMVRDGSFSCSSGGASSSARLPSAGRARGVAAPTESLTPTCTPDLTVLRLMSNRFEVRATYRSYDGSAGDGQAVSLTPDDGYFWFSDDANVELAVKMVGFCGEGSNTIGLYASGLTDLEVTLMVTDRLTGQVGTYTNPLGRPFELIRNGAFVCW